MTLKELKPELIFGIFDEITKVPRPSKKEGKIRQFLIDFAEKHGIEYKTDEIGNVVMLKAATPGYENAPTVVLQGHMDMVCEKNGGVQHDFEHDPIDTYVDGEWVRANGTTLGADNGIGMAAGLAVLLSNDIEHGPIEALFTVDEETGLTGAMNLGKGMISGKYLLNLDSEEDGEICVGCAGGIDTTCTFTYEPVEAPKELHYVKIDIKNLQGGHSGTDINVGRASATKLIARFLWTAAKKFNFKLATINGGNLRNAIAREASAVIGVTDFDKEAIRVELNHFIADVQNEYKHTEKTMEITMESVEAPATVIDAKTAEAVVTSMFVCPHGVISMSLELEGLVETSTNLASVKMLDGNRILVTTSQRSSVESRKYDIANRVEAVFASAGAKVTHGDGYPGWAPNLESKVLKVAVEAHEQLFGNKPVCNAIHAGLECGLFLKDYPYMEMISFGPTLRNVHSPKEAMHIPAVGKFWDLLVKILEMIAKA